MKLFKFFAFAKSKRKSVEEPKDISTLIKHGLSEFFGTILISLGLAGLSTIVAGTTIPVEHFMLHPILVGFYAGFIVVGGVLFIFLRWSCDLNPAVTITRIIQGQNTYRYGAFKIVIQIIGGIIAGLIIFGFGQLGNGTAANEAIKATGAASKTFGKHLGWEESIAVGASWIFFVELVMTSILLFPIFSGIIKGKYRDFTIMFVISMSVWMGILGGSAAINPARGLAQQVPGLFFGYEAGGAKVSGDIISATLSMEAGTLLAPFFYVFCRGLLVEYVNPIVTSIIEFKNYRASNMSIDPQVDKPHTKKAKK